MNIKFIEKQTEKMGFIHFNVIQNTETCFTVIAYKSISKPHLIRIDYSAAIQPYEIYSIERFNSFEKEELSKKIKINSENKKRERL